MYCRLTGSQCVRVVVGTRRFLTRESRFFASGSNSPIGRPMRHRVSWNVFGPITKEEVSVWEGSVIAASDLSTQLDDYLGLLRLV